MCENLIDLTDFEEEKNMESLQHQPALIPSIINNSNNSQGMRQSFENNPFDSMQKLANRQDDPFDIVEKEACAKGLNVPTTEVKMAKLLCFDDCDLLCGGMQQNQSDYESPPIANVTPESAGGSTEGEGSASTDCGKCKKGFESRKRLLKLSITNSTFNSPLSRNNARHVYGEAFPEGDSCCSPISTVFAEAAAQCSDKKLDVESPLKLVEDDLLAEEPPIFLDSDKDFDADLELLAIPMLKHSNPTQFEVIDAGAVEATSNVAKSETSLSVIDVLPDLVALRSKLSARRKNKALVHSNTNSPDNGGNNGNQDVTQLIKHLKTLICDIDIGDDSKKQQASSLLDFLSSALNSEITAAQTTETLPIPQQTIVRQGTFDMDLKLKEKQTTNDNQVQEQNSVQQKPVVNLGIDKIPEAMIKSSATYDCETSDEKNDLQLPEIESAYTITPPAAQADVNDLVQQLSKLLEQNFLNIQQPQINNSNNNYSNNINYTSEDGSIVTNSTSSINPTFIVVMPPSAALPSYMIASRDGSPELQGSSASVRRRSQSLSLHDKVKIVQFPQQSITQITPPLDMNTSTAVSTPPPPDGPEFKTPMRSIPRRNSFSNGTPYTPTRTNNHPIRRSFVGYDSVSKFPTNFIRSSSTLSSHAEGKQQQQHAVVRPMSQGNFNVFKPNFKKKSQTSSSGNSILKSTGPLKATIPVKRVAPMVKVSLTSPDHGSGSQLHSKTRAASMAAPKSIGMGVSYPNACSTPTTLNRSPLKRGNIAMNKPRFSNAASTTAPSTALSANPITSSKRRSVIEPKPKSPIKSSRQSGVGVTGCAVNAAKPSTKSSNGKVPTYVGRTPGKPLPIVPANRGMTHRAGSTTGSIASKSKENKKP